MIGPEVIIGITVASLAAPVVVGTRFLTQWQFARFRGKLKSLKANLGQKSSFLRFAGRHLKPRNLFSRYKLALLPLQASVLFAVITESPLLLGLSAAATLVGGALQYAIEKHQRSTNGLSNVDAVAKLRLEETTDSLMRPPSPKNLKLLEKALKKGHPEARLWILNTLFYIQSPESFGLLTMGLEDPSEKNRLLATAALEQFQPVLLVPHLPRLLSQGTPEGKETLHGALETLPEKTAANFVDRERKGERASTLLAKEVDHIVRVLEVVKALVINESDRKRKEALQKIETELNSGTWTSMRATAYVLAPEGIPELQRIEELTQKLLLFDERPTLILVIKCIEKGEDAIEILLSLLGESIGSIRLEAVWRLEKLGGLSITDLEPIFARGNDKAKEAAVRLLCIVEKEAGKKWLEKILNSGPPSLQSEGLRLIHKMDQPEQYYPFIEDVFRREDRSLYIWAVFAGWYTYDDHWFFRLLEEEKKLKKRTGTAKRLASARLDQMKKAIPAMREKLNHEDTPPEELLCLECNARTVEKKTGKWKYRVCRRCERMKHLKPGYITVVGTIGKGSLNDKEEPARREVNLWDETNKKPLLADIDELEIYDDSQMDYDWAVSAVIESQHNHGLHDAVPVRILGEPAMDINTRHRINSFTLTTDQDKK